jgi:hypothetical protein
MPPVAEYVARIVKSSVENKIEIKEKLQTIDFRKEPDQQQLLL